MNKDRTLLYENYSDFFILDGSTWMRLSREAARQVCLHAVDYGLLVWRIDGGIWHYPGYEPRDCVWDGPDDAMDLKKAYQFNLDAFACIDEEPENIDVFLVMTKPFVIDSKDWVSRRQNTSTNC